jgi:hypothetical protein
MLLNFCFRRTARINRGRKWYQLIDIIFGISRWTFFLSFIQSPAGKKHKTVKRYLIGITWDRLVDIKRRWKTVIAALETRKPYLYRYMWQRYNWLRFFKHRYQCSEKIHRFFFSHEVLASICSGAWRIGVSIYRRLKYQYRYDFLVSSTAANPIASSV